MSKLKDTKAEEMGFHYHQLWMINLTFKKKKVPLLTARETANP